MVGAKGTVFQRQPRQPHALCCTEVCRLGRFGGRPRARPRRRCLPARSGARGQAAPPRPPLTAFSPQVVRSAGWLRMAGPGVTMASSLEHACVTVSCSSRPSFSSSFSTLSSRLGCRSPPLMVGIAPRPACFRLLERECTGGATDGPSPDLPCTVADHRQITYCFDMV